MIFNNKGSLSDISQSSNYKALKEDIIAIF